jgi:hypothetical protein
MDKIDLLRNMDDAWKEAEEHSKNIEKILAELKAQGRPTPELSAQLTEATKHYDRAMHRYKQASASYYCLAVETMA